MADAEKTGQQPTDQLPEIIKALETRLEQHQALLSDYQKRLDEIQKQLDTVEEAMNEVLETKAETPTNATETVGLKGVVFTIGKKKYKLQYPVFNLNGKQYTEESLLADEAAQKELVEQGSKLLLPI